MIESDDYLIVDRFEFENSTYIKYIKKWLAN